MSKEKVSAFILDSDYTENNSGPGYEEAIRQIANRFGDNFGRVLNTWFEVLLQGLAAKDDFSRVPGGKEAFETILKELEEIQGSKPFKPWSREIAFLWVADKTGFKISPCQAIDLANDYWYFVGKHSGLYKDAGLFYQTLLHNNIPLHIMTSPDSRMIYDSERSLWVYDPDYSREKKLKRMSFIDRSGMMPASITVGDPYDKPSSEFYDMVKENILSVQSAVDFSKVITVGDSYNGDVRSPIDYGLAYRGIWIPERTDAPPEQIEPDIIKVGKLTDISIYV